MDLTPMTEIDMQTTSAPQAVTEALRGIRMVHDALADPTRPRQAVGEVASYWVDRITALSAPQQAAPAPLQVRVKKLKWVATCQAGLLEAQYYAVAGPLRHTVHPMSGVDGPFFEHYTIRHDRFDNLWGVRFWVGNNGLSGIGEQHSTVDAAKAAAQADYERRILSALDLSTADPVAWRCERSVPDGNGNWYYYSGPPNPSHLAKNVQALYLAHAALDLSTPTQIAAQEAENVKLRAERDELQSSVWTLEAKVDALAPHGTCACSWDEPNDLCAHHSPKLVAAEAEVARLTEALTLAVNMVMACEPPDSRAISNEAVALASILAGCANDECWEIVRAANTAFQSGVQQQRNATLAVLKGSTDDAQA